jgi:toxin ParE1/3/4
MRIVWSPLALSRVNEIADFISQDSVEAARVWVIDIFGIVERLRDFPESGRIMPEIKRSNIRELIFKNYRVVYKVGRKQISVLTVRHTK